MALAVVFGILLTMTAAGSAKALGECETGEPPHLDEGFVALRASLPASVDVGEVANCVYAVPNGTGDTRQDTTNGLFYWRKSTNTPTYTDGYERWALTGSGIVHWSSSTALDPPPGAEVAGVQVSQPSPGAEAGNSPRQTSWDDFVQKAIFQLTFTPLVSLLFFCLGPLQTSINGDDRAAPKVTVARVMELLHMTPRAVSYAYALEETTWEADADPDFEETAAMPNQRQARPRIVAFPDAPVRPPQPAPATTTGKTHTYSDAGGWIGGALALIALVFYIRHRDSVLDSLLLLSFAGMALAILTVAFLGITKKAVGREWGKTVFWSIGLFLSGIWVTYFLQNPLYTNPSDYSAFIASVQYYGWQEILIAFRSNPMATVMALLFILYQLIGLGTFVLMSICLTATLLFLVSGATLLAGSKPPLRWLWQGVNWASKFPIRSFSGLRSLAIKTSILAVVSVLFTSGTIYNLLINSSALMQSLLSALIG